MSNPNPKSDGFGGENPNPTDSDFLYIRHIPNVTRTEKALSNRLQQILQLWLQEEL
jgi:hypothetical protein